MTSPTSAEENVVVTRDAGVLTLTLNRPERRNALDIDMVQTLIREIESAGTDDDARVIVLRSAGEHFCSGIDLPPPVSPGAHGNPPPKPRLGHLQRGFAYGPHRLITAIQTVQLPVVSVVRGWAAGIGNMVALSADVTLADPTARFWVPFVTKGFTPDSGHTFLLPRLIGLARAREMILRGKVIEGPTAEAWGLISRCAPADELDVEADSVVAEFAGAATVAVGLAKTLLRHNLNASLDDALQAEGIYEEAAVRSDDFKEGMRAFRERREPRYTGR